MLKSFCSLALAVLVSLLVGCGAEEHPGAVEGPRLELLADAAVPATYTHAIAVLSDSVACIIESFERRVLCGRQPWSDVRVLGRNGEGPGEFRIPGKLIAGAAGQVGVHDVALGRLSVFSSRGEYLHHRIAPQISIPLALDSAAYLTATFAPSGESAPQLQRTPLRESEPTSLPLDPPPPLPNGDSAGFRAGAVAFGDEFVFWTGEYHLVRYTAEGEARGVLTPPKFAPERPSELDAELLQETIRGHLGVSPSRSQMREYRETVKAPLSRDNPLRSDGRGRLWALTTRDHVRRSHFDVFERDGHVGTASVPDRVLGYDIRGDLLAALVLVPASEPDGMHGYRVRWYRIAAAD